MTNNDGISGECGGIQAALLVGLLWVGGQTIDALGKNAASTLRSVHISLGFTLAVVLAVRVLWRLTSGRSLPGADIGLLHQIARVTHYLLYLVAGTTVALGVTAAWLRGDAVFGLFAFPGGERELGHTVRGFHALAANAMLILAGLHAAAALFHHYVLRDSVLRRMLPGS
jgi:cytochrome b561